jgi:S1-C subfamily serine protease
VAPDAYDDDDDEAFGHPLPPDDRIWRHPSEVGGFVHAARRRREVSNGKLIAFAAAASLLGSVVTVGSLAAGGAFDRTVVQQTGVTVTETAGTVVAGNEAARWPEIVRRLEPSLARVEASSGASRPSAGTAVAFRTTDRGTYFVTSRDLVQNVDRITLVLGGERRKRAEIIGSDQYTNVAVLFVGDERLEPPAFNRTAPPAGSEAVVVGAVPPDATSPAVAKALIGSLHNTQRARSGVEVQDLLRTDANITADAKGGVLVDQAGALVGLIVVMASDETGVERFGFALPTEAVQTTADSLIRTGYPTQVWLGISGSDLAPTVAGELGVKGGAVLNNVAVGSPAAQCGLTSGDIVIRLNTTDVDSMARLVMALRQLRPTDIVAVEFVRAAVPQRCYTVLAQPPGSGTTSLDGSAPTLAPSMASTTTTAAPGTATPAGAPTTAPAGTPATGPATTRT